MRHLAASGDHMTAGSRPGGLTALAIANLAIGAIDLLGAAGNTVVWLMSRGVVSLDAEKQAKIVEHVDLIGEPAWIVQIGWGAVCGVLLLLAGIGYLRQSRFLGRTLGRTYAVVSLAFAATFAWFLGQQTGEVVNFMVLVAVVYPLLTLLLLGTTFKEDFVR
jgi:hypothetical protein